MKSSWIPALVVVGVVVYWVVVSRKKCLGVESFSISSKLGSCVLVAGLG